MTDDTQTVTPSTDSSGTPPEPEQPMNTQTAESTDTGDFDASAFEVDHGLPEGTLEGVADAQSAMTKLREYTDSILSAGLLASSTQQTAPQTQQAAGTPAEESNKAAQPAKPAEGGNADWEKFRQSVMEEVKGVVQAERAKVEDLQMQQQLQQLDKRIMDEIDSWKSPMYGDKGSRGYKHLKAVRALREMAQTQYAGYVAQNKPPPSIEVLMRQVRAFHDESYMPSTKKKEGGQPPLGTPGTAGSTTGDQPRSIHHAMMGG